MTQALQHSRGVSRSRIERIWPGSDRLGRKRPHGMTLVGHRVVLAWPQATAPSHRPSREWGFRHRCSSAFTSFSFARTGLAIEIRLSWNRPFLLSPQRVRRRKSNVSAYRSRRAMRLLVTNARIRSAGLLRVLHLNLAKRSRRSARNPEASARCWTPATPSSASLTTITSRLACLFLHCRTHRSKTWWDRRWQSDLVRPT